MALSRRRTAFLVAKIAFAVVVITWLFHKVDAARVWSSVRDAHRTPVFLGIALCLLTVVIAGWRWHRLLAIFDISIPLKSLICIAQIGQFFTMFLPGPTGDDLTRMLYVSRFAKDRVGEACTTVLLDRAIGLASILLLALLCVPWQWQSLATSGPTRGFAMVIIVGGIAVCFSAIAYFLIPGVRLVRIADMLFKKLPQSKLRIELYRMSHLVSENKRLVAQVVIAAIGTQLLICGFYILAGRAVGVRVPALTWLGFVPIVLAANAVPITIGGFGVREYLLILFLGVLAHVESEDALSVSFIVFSMTFAVCLTGGVVYLLYKPHIEVAKLT